MTRSPVVVEVVAADAFAEAAADRFEAAAVAAISARGRFVAALTGGSTPGPMHAALARRALDWRRCVLTVGDDRLVPDDDPRNNLAAARRALLDHVPATVLPLRMPALGGSPRRFARRAERAAAAFDRALRRLGGLDLLVVGLGADAHVLSLFPHCPYLHERARRCVPVLDPPMNPAVSRLTLTPVALREARAVLGLAAGRGKRAAVTAALTQGPVDEVPARLLQSARHAVLLCDRDAAPVERGGAP